MPKPDGPGGRELLKNRANIDTGAYATGNLTLMTLQGTSMLAV
jgi:serine/threonine protein phosphatase 1